MLVNGLGATTQLELFVIYRRVRQILSAREIEIHANWVGEYATSLEMAGASVTLPKLDDRLSVARPSLPDAGVDGGPGRSRSCCRHAIGAQGAKKEVAIDRTTLKTSGAVTPEKFVILTRSIAGDPRRQRSSIPTRWRAGRRRPRYYHGHRLDACQAGT
ncbi:dihydroxyacetone kinase subunit DhaK [Shinella sp.]|uniref:dihydroxyacetone kinase subunit DhaK n=1 Tax=Shinella sp. TaxID=1870904 RepID=UPI0029BFD465|nr:dihydroxyacetone kinase subunit DhaK [Shinella sp.]